MANETVKLVLEAKDLASEAVKKLKSAMEDFSQTAGKVNTATSKLNSVFSTLQKHWLALSGAIGSTIWLRNAILDALEAEKAFNKLKIQIEGLGIAYDSISKKVEDHINTTSKYAIAQEEDVAKTLQELIFYSGDYEKSLENLNLTYDFAYQKGISTSEAAALIGKAMTGNVEMIGRYIPELKNLDKKLGENATEAEKTAYAFAILKEKSANALSEMKENEKKLKEMKKTWEDFKQAVGGVALKVVVGGIKEIGSPIETTKSKTDELVTSLKNIWNAFRYGSEEAERMAKAEAKLREEMEKTPKEGERTSNQLKKEIKTRSDEIDAIKDSISARDSEAKALEILANFELDIEERRYKNGEVSLKEYINTRLRMEEDYAHEMVSIREKQIESLKSLPEDIQDPAKVKALQEEITQIMQNSIQKRKALQGELRDSISQSLKDSEDKYKQYAEKIKELDKKIEDNKSRSIDKIRALDRKLMSSIEAYKDAQAEAAEFGRKVKEALTEGDLTKAEAYAKKMEDAYASLPEEIKIATGQMVISQQEGINTIKTGMQEAINLQNEIYEAQKQKAEEAKAAEAGRVTELKGLLTNLNAEFSKITDPKNINIDTTEAMAKIDSLLAKLNKIEAKKNVAMSTTPVGATGMASGGLLSGYGGGDSIPAILEAGEFIHRKEAVRYYGTSLMSALNRMLLPKNLVEILQGLQKKIPRAEFHIPLKMQGGGKVGEVPILGHYSFEFKFPRGEKASVYSTRDGGENLMRLLEKHLRQEILRGG